LAGDSEARYQRLLDSCGREVFAYCRRRTDAETAADCAAETFLVAWRRLDDVPDGGAGLGWLLGVARRVMANEFRRTRRLYRLLGRLRRFEPASTPGPEAVVVRRESERMVLAAVSRLRPEDQELLRLALWEELPHAEIAAVVGCSPQAASQRLHRATRRVANEYERLDRGHAAVGTPEQLREREAG
jgi:RNA polymerase sigma-70 factor (ECF subfamily)